MRGYINFGITFIKRFTGLCIKIGTDLYGNTYYQDRYFFLRSKSYPKRWVVYKGKAEGSKIPADWHGWLHYTTERVPELKQNQPWQKPYVPNLSGTAYTYNSLESKSKAKKTYKSWTPE